MLIGVYTPTLNNYLPSLLSGVKTVAILYEHVYGFLAKTKLGENVVLSYEQMKDLGAITSNAICLPGNASALFSKQRHKAVLNKINLKGTFPFLASEEVSASWQKFVWGGI